MQRELQERELMRPLPENVKSFPFLADLSFQDDENDAPTGEVTAIVASLEVADEYGRIVHAGAVGSQPVIVSSWGHNAMFGADPVAVGRVFEDDLLVRAELQYDLADPDSAKAYRTVRRTRGVAHWSIAYDSEEMEERQGQLHFWAIDCMETSPVTRGASPGTRTVIVQDRGRFLRPGAAWLETAKLKLEIASREMS